MAGLFGNSRRRGPIGLFEKSGGVAEEEQRRLADLALLAGRLGGGLQSHELEGIPPRERYTENLMPMAQLPLLHRNILRGASGLPFPPGLAGDPKVLGLPGAAGESIGRSPIAGLRAEAEVYADQMAQRGAREWGSAVRDFVMQGPISSSFDGVRSDEEQRRGALPRAAEEEDRSLDFGPATRQFERFRPAGAEAESPRQAALFREGEGSPTQFMRPVAFQDSLDRSQDRAIAQEQAKRTGHDAGVIYGTLRGFPNQEPQERVSLAHVRPTQARSGARPRLLEPDEQAPGQRLQASAMPSSDAQRAPTPRELVKNRIRIAESTNDDRAVNSESTAMGRYQFIDSTWKSLHRRFYGTDGLDDKFNPEKQERFMDALMDENEAALRKGGFEPTARNLYLAHFAGWPSALNLLRTPGASAEALLGKDAVRRNERVLKGKTAAQVIEWAGRKMNGEPPKAEPSRARARVPRR